jgi:hypothetical protein
MLGVLHTVAHARFHPHIHYLIAGGGLSPDGRTGSGPKGLSLIDRLGAHARPSHNGCWSIPNCFGKCRRRFGNIRGTWAARRPVRGRTPCGISPVTCSKPPLPTARFNSCPRANCDGLTATIELSDAGGPARPHRQLPWPACVRSSDFVERSRCAAGETSVKVASHESARLVIFFGARFSDAG